MEVAILQANLLWENPVDNIAAFEREIIHIPRSTKLIVLPEMFSTGFSMQPEKYAQKMNGDTVKWMLAKAAELQIAICGSLMIEENSQYFNRFIMTKSDGSIYAYNKRHLFSMGEEHLHYQSGVNRILIPMNDFIIYPVVCYDIRFPVWLNRTADFDFDVLLVVANWPERRAMHWKALLCARAIENQCYVIACNRVGLDGNGVNHSGDSCVISPLGEVITTLNGIEGILYHTLIKKQIEDIRAQFPLIKDTDSFKINY